MDQPLVSKKSSQHKHNDSAPMLEMTTFMVATNVSRDIAVDAHMNPMVMTTFFIIQ